jgi:hypothetical protein
VIRRLAAGLIVVGLAVGIWALWPDDDSSPSPTTTPTAAETTTTVPVTSTTTTTTIATTSTVSTHVVATVEEAEEILRNLWFGWFEGIYNQDEARIREVVGSPSQIEAAQDQFGQLEMSRPPTPQDFVFTATEILEATEECTAVWSDMSASGFTTAEVSGVHVFRWLESSWLFVSLWTHRDDLWRNDCTAPY